MKNMLDEAVDDEPEDTKLDAEAEKKLEEEALQEA